MLMMAEVPQDAGSYASFVLACDRPSLRRPPFLGAACARASAAAPSVIAVAALPKSTSRRSRLIVGIFFDICVLPSHAAVSRLRSAAHRRRVPGAIRAGGARSGVRA